MSGEMAFPCLTWTSDAGFNGSIGKMMQICHLSGARLCIDDIRRLWRLHGRQAAR